VLNKIGDLKMNVHRNSNGMMGDLKNGNVGTCRVVQLE
jgi:hypothetical protein